MDNPTVTLYVDVDHRSIEDLHIFTSRDVKGLYVASKDSQKALDGLPGIIKKLVKYNHGYECEVIMIVFRDRNMKWDGKDRRNDAK